MTDEDLRAALALLAERFPGREGELLAAIALDFCLRIPDDRYPAMDEPND